MLRERAEALTAREVEIAELLEKERSSKVTACDRRKRQHFGWLSESAWLSCWVWVVVRRRGCGARAVGECGAAAAWSGLIDVGGGRCHEFPRPGRLVSAPARSGCDSGIGLIGGDAAGRCGRRVGVGSSPAAGFSVVESVAFAFGLDDAAAVGEPVEGCAGESFGAEHFGPGLEREVGGDDHAGAFVGGRDDVEEQFGADLGGWDVAEFVEDEQVELGELGFEAEEAAFVAGFDQGGDELGGAVEADLVAAGACFGGERGGEVALAGAGVADEQDVLALVDVLAAGELGYQPLVHRRAGGEVEALERLHGREPGGLQPSLGGALLSLEQLEFAELEEVGEVVLVVGRGLGGDLLGTRRRWSATAAA